MFVITLICKLRILFVIRFASGIPGVSYNYTMFSFQIMVKCKINNMLLRNDACAVFHAAVTHFS